MAHSGCDMERDQMMAISLRGLFAHTWLWKVKLEFERFLKVGQNIIDYFAFVQFVALRTSSLCSIPNSTFHLDFFHWS